MAQGQADVETRDKHGDGATKQMRTWRAVALAVVVLALLFCGAMIGLAVSLARELNRVKATCNTLLLNGTATSLTARPGSPPPAAACPACPATNSTCPPPRNVTCPPPPLVNATSGPTSSSPSSSSPAGPQCNGFDSAANVTFPPRVADVFTPFTQDELDRISAFVRSSLNLADGEPEDGTLTADWLYAIDFLPDNKTSVLNYVDGNRGSYPGRFARAIVFNLANPSNASVVEYKVGPLRFPIPATTPIVPIPQGGTLGGATSIPYLMRPVSGGEYAAMEPVVSAAMETLSNLSTVSYGETYDGGNIFWTDSSPRGYTRATRQSWIWFMWNIQGMYGTPMGLEMLIDHSSLNASDWSIIQLGYNSQGPFASPEALAASFNSGSVTPLRFTRPVTNDTAHPPVTSMLRRGPQRPLEDRPLPFSVQPGCPRYAVKGSQVSWLSWDLNIGYEIVAGITLNDVRFRNQRVVYELALQDAYAAYSGTTPIQALSQYSDGGWGMGYSGFTLMPGVDCPTHATFLNISFFVDGGSKTSVHSVCVFEQPAGTGAAIARHYDQDFAAGDGFTWVAGYPKTELVIKTTSTVYNYDYYYSYIFHLDGTMEVHTMASGYLQADNYPQTVAGQAAEMPWGTRVTGFAEGSLHSHLFGYKVDIDVMGANNSLTRMDTKVSNFARPWNFDGNGLQQYLYNEHAMVAAEGPQSVSVYDPRHPTMLTIANNGSPNAWGQPRGWAVHIPGTSLQLLNDTAPFMKASQWTKYNVAVLQRKETEQRSCRVLYDMQAPGDPLVTFDSFISGDPVQNTDLVAWVTVGTIHTPSAEDVPVTTTSTTAVRFFIRPVNYFDESPVTDLTRTFFATGAVHPYTPTVQVNNVFIPTSTSTAAGNSTSSSVASAGMCFGPPTAPFDFVYVPPPAAAASA